jgi:hypothetical protein
MLEYRRFQQMQRRFVSPLLAAGRRAALTGARVGLAAEETSDEHDVMVQPANGAFNRKEQTMKQRLYGIRLLAAVLATLALSGPATAGKQVPFKGRSSGVVTAVGFDPVAGIAYFHLEGEGQATHLGRFTVTGDVAVDVATGTPQGTWTLTAANGDQLFLAMGRRGIFGAFTVVGGTGRFQGATGYYEQIITFAVPLGTADIIAYTDVLEGTISSPGSNK